MRSVALRRRPLTRETFDQLLVWLDPDPDKAGERYEAIRRTLIKIFVCRGCPAAEELADETITLVAHKVMKVAPGYVGDPALYFYGVGHRLHLDYVRRRPVEVPIREVVTSSELHDDRTERRHQCLDRCMQALGPKSRQLILTYYQSDKHVKVSERKRLAQELGISENALRIRLHRIRRVLHACVERCLERDNPAKAIEGPPHADRF